ncbi:hypothetical protein Tco_1339209 [Tanacetum coccineum]
MPTQMLPLPYKDLAPDVFHLLLSFLEHLLGGLDSTALIDISPELITETNSPTSHAALQPANGPATLKETHDNH